jgi:hypothetical protein
MEKEEIVQLAEQRPPNSPITVRVRVSSPSPRDYSKIVMQDDYESTDKWQREHPQL